MRDHERLPTFRLGLVAVAVLLSFHARAESRFDLGRVEVSAEQSLPGEGNNAVDAEVIQQENRETVADALDLLPGVTMNNVGARNEQTVYVRGFDLRQVPVFIDGVPVYVPYDGYVDLGRFTTFDLAEVSVAKGFSSVLYGPNTLGGAINLVTRKPTKPFEGEVGAGYARGDEGGSDQRKAWANLGARAEQWYTQIGVSWLDQDAYALSDDFDTVATEDGGLRENSYREDTKFSIKVGYTPNASDEYAVGYVNQQGEKGTPPYAGDDPSVRARYWQWPYWDKESLYFVSRTGLGDGSYVKTRFYHDTFENSLYSYDDASYTTISRPYAFRSWYDDYGYGGSVEYGRPIGSHMLRLAGHYKFDHHEEHNAGEPIRTFEDRTTSLALEDTITLSQGHYVVVGVSYDTRDSLEAQDWSEETGFHNFPDNDASAFNPQIGYFVQLTPEDEARITLSHKSRFPTIKDRYSYRLGSAIPNPDLDPEEATTLEAGWNHRFGETARIETTLFYSSVRDLIQSVDLDANTYQLQNIGKVRVMGLELAGTAWVSDSLELHGNYTYLSRENVTSPSIELTDVPEHKLFAQATWHPTDPLSLGASAQYESERYSSTDGIRKADAFTVFGLKAGYEFGHGVSGRVGVQNLLDTDYAYQEGYPEPGRTWYADLRWRF